uniref:CSON011058 protein n=1 Tax=Culicoides sonorensis TaxID=179676 RepID=A0A336KTI1_CULSO
MSLKKLPSMLNEFVTEFRENGPGSVDHDMDKGIMLMKKYEGDFEELEKRRLQLVMDEKLFDIPLADYTEFLQCKSEFEGMHHIYDLYKEQKQARETWSKTLWINLNPQALIDGIEDFIKEFKKFPKVVRDLEIAKILDTKMKQFKNTVPLMVSLKNEALRERHWKMLMEKTGQYFDMAPDQFTLENMFAMELHRFSDITDEIINNAVKELMLDKGLKKVIAAWDCVYFTVQKHFKAGNDRGYILGSVEEINSMLDDNLMSLQSMAASQFVGPFLGLVKTWERRLAQLSLIIDKWTTTQRKWMYLEGVFIGSDIRTQLPEEAAKFDIMKEVIENSKVIDVCLVENRLQEFKELISGMDNCQKSLTDYLESKRRIFPRFYFISTEELLSILGNTEPGAVQEHMIKMFDNIKMLQLSKDPANRPIAIAMISIYTEGRVENWMNDVLDEMRKTNCFITKKAIYDYGKERQRPRTDWIMLYQGMVCLAGNQAWWTAEVEEVFRKIKLGNKRAMKEFLESQNRQLDDLVNKVRSELSNNDRLKFKTIATIDVHARDIIEAFVKNSVLDSQDFGWESQLRFYWVKETDNLHILQCTGRFDYGYEYMGLNGRLVITPLTDRIYLTLTQALTMNLGGAPAGPAGTGKTETTKDLAKAMALLCIVTNCGEGMDYRAIGTVLSGLAQCGAWGCFDEFNRIDISVLSVISTQLQTIRNALVAKVETFLFGDVYIKIDRKVGVFITMNPGYAGRTELPESVKALFRPVTCIMPDLELICLISLFSDGFATAKILAKKMTVLYKLAKEQLSKQFHYDWGLRSLNSVLRMAGVVKRASSDTTENVVLMRVLRDMNFPKFVFDDVPLFLGLLKDLFPGVDCPRIGYPDFNSAVKQVLEQDNMILLPDQMDKILQLYETMMTRHCTMIVGPSGGGKTVVLSTLIKAQTLMGLPTKCTTLNPKACTVVELYGYLDPKTRDWIDGLFSNIFREMNKPTTIDERRYICFDGDVDALWIENMNSVMDDNKLLTLANGERIRLNNYCALLFEVGDLAYASPATVSRAGMVYVDPKNLGYIPIWQRWLNTRHSDEFEILDQLFNQFIPSSMEFIHEGVNGSNQEEPLDIVIAQSSLNMITQFCHMYDALLPLAHSDSEQNIDMCLYGSLGATLMDNARIRFDEFVKAIAGMPLVEDSREKPAASYQFPTCKPTLYDYTFDKDKMVWIAWEWLVPNYTHNRELNIYDILVPTIDTLRTEWLLQLMNSISHSVLLVGDAGTSKTAVISHFLKNLNPKIYQLLNINFSSRTTSLDVQKTIETAVEKRTKDVYGPPVGKKLNIFIDDMNMPCLDDYGTQQPIALLKQLIQYGGMYDRRNELAWQSYKDFAFLAAMGRTGGGRNEVDRRFISMFSVLYIPLPSDSAILHIFSSILKGHLSIFPPEFGNTVDTVTQMTLNIFKVIVEKLPPTPSKFHYIFNLKDLTRIFCGMLQVDPIFFKEVRQLVRVWRNEFSRVICDRLVTADDQRLLYDLIYSEIKENFNELEENSSKEVVNIKAKLNSESISRLSDFDYIMRDPILFGDYRNSLNEDDGRFYEDLLDYEAVYFLFQEILEEYNTRKSRMSLVLFEDCLEHLTRLHRNLRLHRGHVLLIGVGGSGKQSVTRLATFAANCDLFEIQLSKGYNEHTFKEDLKHLYNNIGVRNKRTVFMFTDAQIAKEGFLEFINNILTVGVVPALFSDDEKDTIIGQCRNAAKAAGFSVGRNDIWSYFLENCAKNLHVVLCMSPIGDVLRNRCRSFPGLVSNTTIDWVFPWPDEALFAVAKTFLSGHSKIPQIHREPVISHVVHVHNSIKFYSAEFLQKMRRKNFVTPKHYLDYINTYIKLIDERHAFIAIQCLHLSDGIKKIDDASVQIDVLRIEVEAQRKDVLIAATECEKMLQGIEQCMTTEITNKKKQQASAQSAEVEVQSKQIATEKTEAEIALSEALPALEEARKALDKLNKSDLAEIRAFTTPPLAVQREINATVCECICIMKGFKDYNWKVAKQMLVDVNFVKDLKGLNPDIIPSKSVNLIKAHMKKCPELDKMKEISKAGNGLLKFVKAVLGYCDVYKEVRPKKERVAFLEKELESQISLLEKLTIEISKLTKQLEDLNDKLNKSLARKAELQSLLEQAEQRLQAADKLIVGLFSEKDRWTIDLQNLGVEQSNLIGTCLICASFLAYTGAFSWDFRKTMIYQDWLEDIKSKDIPVTLPIKFEDILSDDVQISTWNSQGLPPDEFSIQNGILTSRASRFPLCIDPQQQALPWIKKKEFENGLKILSFSDQDFQRQLEMSIQSGNPVLFQDVDDYIDPMIDNILEKNIKVVSGQSYLMLGDREIEFNPNFRIYLTTKLANPTFDPSVYAKAMVINYSVTESGLEDQLLSVVVRTERPDLEDMRENLISENSINKNLLQKLEDSLLHELTSNTGNMLDNTELVTTLENTKTKASEILEKLALAQVTSKEIEVLRDGYRSVSKRGAILFFVLSDLALVDTMYQYSLHSFLVVFTYSLRKAIPDIILSKRLTNIIETLTKNIYEYGCTGIFERHKLLFSFQITTRLQQSVGLITQKYLDFFIKGSISIEKSSEKVPCSWLTSKQWDDIIKLTNDFPDTFGGLSEHIERNMDEWTSWYELEAPEEMPCPGNFSEKMKYFDNLMLIRCFRMDRVYRATNLYISNIMGERFIMPPVVSLNEIYEQTNSNIPVVFILSPGSDPTSDLMKLAKRCKILDDKFKYISLGQGQEQTALKLLNDATKNGYWLILQNGHLLVQFMKELEKYLEKIENRHENFRLFITTDSTSTFPIGMLQISLKVVTEPPSGLKMNLKASVHKLTQTVLDSCSHTAFKPLLYVLTFFHAVVQVTPLVTVTNLVYYYYIYRISSFKERRKYGKLGWNITYDFNESDYQVCIQILGIYLSKAISMKETRIPWNSLKYLIGEVMYGGRVIDDFDRRIVQTYMDEYMGDFLFDPHQPYHFYHNESVDYVIPEASTRQEFIDFVDELPLSNSPEVFGLHPNAEIGYYTQAVKEMLHNLIELQPQTGITEGTLTRDEIIDNVADDILKKLPKQFEIMKIKKAFQMTITPTGVVLLQELERFNKLLARIEHTLMQLRKALAGELGMDPVLDKIANSLFNGQLPDHWRKLAPQTCKQLGGWIDHLLKRSQQYKYWSVSGEPLVMWLSGLHIPESYLTALIQVACRKNNWCLDRSTLFSTVTEFTDPDDIEERHTLGCYVHGLFLQGARWDIENQGLARSTPKILIEPLPILSIVPTELHRLKLQNTFKTPIYTTSLRRNAMGVGLVFEGDLRTQEHPSHWILQGVCLILNED